jgi:pimeloyl-ACP methyl ester carboxylesterase
VKRTDGTFRAQDGTQLHYTKVTSGHATALVVAPGVLMHRGQAEHRLLADRLCELADVYTVDVRGHGDSEGAFTFGQVEPEDLADFARSLREEYGRVGGLGFSFGGYSTCIAAAEHRVYDAVALVGTPHRLFILDHNFLTRGLARSLPAMAKRQRRLTRVKPSWPLNRRVPSELIEQIAPTPLLVVQGADDWLIPEKHGRELFRRAREPKELVVIPGGLHAETMLVEDPEPLLTALSGFFRERL